MSEIKFFQNPAFGQIRTMVLPDGQIGFAGKDVANVLGYANSRDALRKHVEKEDKTTVAICDSGSNYKTQAVFINESGLYSLILSSKLPTAREFKHWVTGEVLPQIRKTGGYIPVDREDDDLTIMAKAYQILQRTIAEQKEQLEESRKVIEDITPMAEYAEKVLLSPTCYTMTQVAKSLSMTVQELQLKLQQSHVIYRSPSGCWMLYAEHLKLGYEAYRTRQGNNHEGDVVWTDTYLVWTERGKEFIHQLVKYERNI
ncbi:MAG: phage antirepressor KilAC domain-containing protein [Bacteroidaceae bacterium]|nr:phage antirepressor KilAC domain-containing protein [Bacteroidaceae bacterium]